MEERGWAESGGKDGEEEDEGRAGQGLSVKKTAMKGNCHAPVLTQEHLSGEEHAKCAGHVLTIPPLSYTKINAGALAHTESSEEKGDVLRYQKGIACLTTCQSSCRWPLRICKEKVRLMKKNTLGGGPVREKPVRYEHTSRRFDVGWVQEPAIRKAARKGSQK